LSHFSNPFYSCESLIYLSLSFASLLFANAMKSAA
jgi:hypothetical protein